MQFFPLGCLPSMLEVREPTVEGWGFTTSSTAENACTVYLCQIVGSFIKSNWPIVHSDWIRKAIVHSDWIRKAIVHSDRIRKLIVHSDRIRKLIVHSDRIRKLCIVTGLGNPF